METLIILTQIILACAMIDVWLVRYESPGRFRGGDARTMKEEFSVYGLPSWFRRVVRVMKLSCGAALIVGIAIPEVALVGSAILAILMAGATVMHFKVGDPIYKAAPAFTFLILSLFVALSHAEY